MQRNELAYYLQNDNRLPPMLKNAHTCKSCHHIDQCTVYHKALENGTKESSGIGELFSTRTEHLTPNQIGYFSTWNKLIDLEKSDAQHLRKEVWTMSGSEREKLGR